MGGIDDENGPIGPDGTPTTPAAPAAPAAPDDLGVVTIPKAIRRGYATRLTQISGSKVSSVDEIPGGNTLARLGLLDETPKEFPRDWQVVRVSLGKHDPKRQGDLVRKIRERKGDVLAVTHASTKKFELFAVLPTPLQARALTSEIDTEFKDNEPACGIQSKPGAYGRIVNGAVAFYGKGISSARDDVARQAVSLEAEQTDFEKPVDSSSSEYLCKNFENITDLSNGPGAIAIIEIPNLVGRKMDVEESEKVQEEITNLVDRNKDTITWVGNRIVLTMTTENAARKLAARFTNKAKTGILDRHEGADIRVRIAHGELKVREIEGTKIKYIESDAFDSAESAPTLNRRGIVVPVETYKNITKIRGAKVDSRIINEKYVEILKLDEKVSEIETEGPSELIGRETIMHEILKEIQEWRGGKNRFVVFGGKPGIGKSRLLKETAEIIKKEPYHALLTQTVAQQEDSIKGYSFIDNFVRTLVEDYKADKEDPNYKLLSDTEFSKGGSPERVASAIFNLLKNSKRPLKAIMLDDLQWCDEKSAQIIAMLIDLLNSSGRNKVLMMLSAREVAGEMPAILKDALTDAQACEIEVGPLPFDTPMLQRYVTKSFERDVDVEGAPNYFWDGLKNACAGVPYFVTAALVKMEERGAIRVNELGELIVKDDIKYKDYADQGLFTSMILECPPKEREVLRALRIFANCRVKEPLFRKLFPEYAAFLDTLISRGTLVREKGQYIQPNHSLLREAMEQVFDKGPLAELSYDIYKDITTDPRLKDLVTAEEKFALVEDLFVKMPPADKNFKEVAEAAMTEGGLTVKSFLKSCRYPEVLDLLAIFRRKSASEGVIYNEEDTKAMLEALSRAYFGTGNGEEMVKTVKATMSREKDQRKRVELAIQLCDACYMAADTTYRESGASQPKQTTIQEAVNILSAEIAELSETERIYPELLVKMNCIRLLYRNNEYENAAEQCAKLLTEIKEEFGLVDEENDSGAKLAHSLEILPTDKAQLFAEAERFFIKLKTEIIKRPRELSDSDAAYATLSTEEEAAILEALKERSERLAYAVREAMVQLVRTLKDDLSARRTNAQIYALSGDLDKAEKLAGEAARIAELSGESTEAAHLLKLVGDASLSHVDMTTERAEKAAKAYRRGATLLDAKGDKPRRQDWYQLAGSVITAFTVITTEREVSDAELKEIWRYANEVYKVQGELVSSNTGYLKIMLQYLIPPMAELRRVAALQDLELIRPTEPFAIGREYIDRIEIALRKLFEQVKLEPRYNALTQVLSTKIAWLQHWLKTRDELKTPPEGSPSGGSETSPEPRSGYELGR